MRMFTTIVLLSVLLAIVLTPTPALADERRLLRFAVWDETEHNPIPQGEGWVDGFQRTWLFAQEKDRSLNAWMGDHKLLVYIRDSDGPCSH